MSKKMLFACLALLMLITFGCKPKSDKKSDNPVLSKNIEYDVTINNFKFYGLLPLSESNDNWSRENIEASSRGAFLDLLFKTALEGKLSLTDLNGKSIDTNKLKALLTTNDTVTLMRDYAPFNVYDTVVANMLSTSMVTAIRFRENWTYDAKTMAVTKKVIAMAPVASSVSMDKQGNEIIGSSKALFWVVYPEKISASKVLTKRIVSTVTYGKDPWHYLLNADSAAINTYIQKLLQRVYSDSITAYELSSGGLPVTPLTGKEWKNFLNSIDTISLKRTTPPYATYDTIIKRVFEVSAIRFLEEWTFDPATMAIEKKVAGVCPVVILYDESHESKGLRPLFWVYFGDVWAPFDEKLELKKKETDKKDKAKK